MSPATELSELPDILRLKQLFATLSDSRVIGRVLHPLPEVLLVALCAMLSDCEDFTDVGHFARSQLPWLRQFTPLRHGPPSHDVFHALQPELLLEIMVLWGGELRDRQVSIDGPAVAGSAAEPRTAPPDAAPCTSCEPGSARHP